MRLASVCLLGMFLATSHAAEVPLPEGATLRIGDPNALRAVDSPFAFSADGQWLYVLEARDTIRPWNLVQGTRGRAIKGPAPYASFTVSPDGKWLATREQANTVRLWNIATATKERLWTATGQVMQLAFTADSKHLVGVQDGRTFKDPGAILYWSVTADEAIRTFAVGSGKDPRVSSIAVSPDGKKVAVVGQENGPVRVFDLANGTELGAWGKAGSYRPTPPIAFKGNDQLLVAFGTTLSEFDLTKKEAMPTVITYPRSIEALAPAGTHVALATAEFARFEVWDVAANKAGKIVGVEHAKSRSGLGFAPDGKSFVLIAGGQFTPPRVWDTTTGAERLANSGHPVAVQSLAVIEQGKTLVSGAADGQLRFWDTTTGAAKKPTDLRGNYLELSADGSRLLTVASNGYDSLSNVRLYETATLKQIAAYDDTGKAVALSPDGKRVAFRTENGIRIYDVEAEKLLADEPFKPSLLNKQSFAFGPDPQRLIVQPYNGLLMLNALSKVKPKENVYLQTEGFVRSPDGRQLATLLNRTEGVTILDATTGRTVTSFKMKTPTAMAWSRDGQWVGTADGVTLYVWSAKSGSLRLKRLGHDANIRAITFAPDGKSVFTGGEDHLVYQWTLPPSK